MDLGTWQIDHQSCQWLCHLSRKWWGCVSFDCSILTHSYSTLGTDHDIARLESSALDMISWLKGCSAVFYSSCLAWMLHSVSVTPQLNTLFFKMLNKWHAVYSCVSLDNYRMWDCHWDEGAAVKQWRYEWLITFTKVFVTYVVVRGLITQNWRDPQIYICMLVCNLIR